MKSVYDEIYERAEPYWATRQNGVHVPISYDFARLLLIRYPEADEAVVLPAILLHDIGWKMVPEHMQLNAFGPKGKDTETRRFHETEGVRIAKEILSSLNYDQEKIGEILSIIGGHDTRPESLSLNDQLVKDADKLWRFTYAGVKIDHTRFGIPAREHIAWLSDRIEDWFFTRQAKDMARTELTKVRNESDRL